MAAGSLVRFNLNIHDMHMEIMNEAMFVPQFINRLCLKEDFHLL